MKKIEAIIKTEKFNEVKEALEKAGFPSMSVIEVQGRGEERDFKQLWRASIYVNHQITRIKIEMFVRDEAARIVTNEILRTAWTGNIGDGIISITEVEDAVRIRTGEGGEGVL